jgi:hypothetical protein
MFNANNKTVSRALSTLISKKKSLLTQKNVLIEYTHLRESRHPWFAQYRGYADTDNKEKDAKDKTKGEDEETEDKNKAGKEEDEAKPDEEEAKQAGQFGGAGASVFMGSFYYLVTRQQVESTKKDSNLVLMLDLASKRRVEEQVALMRLNGVETLRDMVTPTTEVSDNYFEFNPAVISFERVTELMKDTHNIPTLLESGAIRRITDPEEIAKIEQMTPSQHAEHQVTEKVVTRSFPNIHAAAMEWLRKPENRPLRRIMFPRKPRWRKGWYSGFLFDFIKMRLIYAPLLALLAALLASFLLLLWLLFGKTPRYHVGRLATFIKESIFAATSVVLPLPLPTPKRDYNALRDSIYQELVDEGYVVLPEEIDPEPNPDEPMQQNTPAE